MKTIKAMLYYIGCGTIITNFVVLVIFFFNMWELHSYDTIVRLLISIMISCIICVVTRGNKNI